MISRSNVLNKFADFTRVAAPILYVHNDEAYADSLDMVAYLMELVGEDHERSENLLITILGHAIKEYESHDPEMVAFEREVEVGHSDVAMLRLIIEQNQLTLSDLPEIGHKSLVSKILSGERHLTKSHIEKLCKRFHLDPGLFF